MAQSNFHFDGLIESCNDPRLQVDLALFNQRPPSDEALVRLIHGHAHVDRLVQAVHALRAAADTDAIVAAASKMTPTFRPYQTFNGYPVRGRMFPSGPVQVPTFTDVASEPVMAAIRELTEGAANLLVDIFSQGDRELEFVQREGTAVSYPIHPNGSRRGVTPLPPPIETIQGLQLSIDGLWSSEMQAVMAVVLWQAEVKPYIEGEITFSSELRKKYETFASTGGLECGVGPYRRGFFYLTQGARAPWRLNVTASNPTDMRVGSAVARFSTSLQHLLRGSAARADLLNRLLVSLARHAGKTPSEVAAALIAGTGAERPPGVTY